MILKVPEVEVGSFARAADLAFQPLREQKADSSVALPLETLLQTAKDIVAAGHVGASTDHIEVEVAHITDASAREEVFAVRVRTIEIDRFESLFAEAEDEPDASPAPAPAADEAATVAPAGGPVEASDGATTETPAGAGSAPEPTVPTAETVTSGPAVEDDPPVEETADSAPAVGA